MGASWSFPSPTSPADATVEVPGSESIMVYTLYLVAVADSPSAIWGALDARSTRLFAAVPEVMSTHVENEGTGILRVAPMSLSPRGGRIECGLADTVMRLLSLLAALSPEGTLFDGDKQACACPLGPLLDALVRMGTTATHHGERGHLPFTIQGPIHTPLGAQVWVDPSSPPQSLSVPLFISPLIGDPLFVSVPSIIPSVPHVGMTLVSLVGAGTDLEVVDEGHANLSTWHIFPSRPIDGDITVESDLSNVDPSLAAAMVTDGRVRIPAWPGATTQTGDAWRTLFGHMGATTTLNEGGLTLTGPGAGNYPGIRATMVEVGGLTPALAAICAYASTPSHLNGTAHLRGYGTDRLTTLVTEINRVGGQAEETEDRLIITSRPLHAAQTRSCANHRMTAFGAILGLIAPGTAVDDIACTSETLSTFEAMWASLVSENDEESTRAALASSIEKEKR